MAGADNFAVQEDKAAEAVEWMNEYAKKSNLKFEARLEGYSMQTAKFGNLRIISWKGEWTAARNIARRVSSKLRIKSMESGFHEDRALLSAMFGGAEFAKVYYAGRLVGSVELARKSGQWTAKSESFA